MCLFCICEPQSVRVSAALLSLLSFTLCVCVCVCASLCIVLRKTLRLHSEKESHASGGTEEGHFWVWWVWRDCCVCVLYVILIFYMKLFSDVWLFAALKMLFSSNTLCYFGFTLVCVQAGGSGLCMENQACSPVSTSTQWLPLTSWFYRLTAQSLGTDRGKWLHLLPSLWPWGPP